MATNNRSAPPINADTPYSELPELLTAQELAAYRRSTVGRCTTSAAEKSCLQ
jgi:hypothetical protein